MAPLTVETRPGEEFTLTVGDVDYLLVPNSENFVTPMPGSQPSVYLVLVYLVEPGETISLSALHQFRHSALCCDDVFLPEFFTNVVFYGAKEDEVLLEEDVVEALYEWGTTFWTYMPRTSNAHVAHGPYVAMNGKAYQPWRIYNDFNGCFMKAFKPSSDGTGRYVLLTLDSPNAGLGGRVIVPSRCYFNPSKERPLDGVRISVKDNIDIAGHKTTLCNRAWEDLHPPKTKNAACVQVLVDAGAIIVGKVKLQAMMTREEPLECVEFAAPFNPRGDGYQVPSGTSHGSAAGVASYEWLDFSLGSDTNGGGRKPAHYNGCFALRPSTGTISTDGLVGQFEKFDMPVLFGREIARFREFVSVWYGTSPMLRNPSYKMTVKILYPLDYLPTVNPCQSRAIDKFVRSLEAIPCTRTVKISLIDMWKRSLPAGPNHSNLEQFLQLAGSYPYYWGAYHAMEDFRNKYEEKHGKPPFVHRAMHLQWDIAQGMSVEQRDLYWHRSEFYRNWLLKNVFDAESRDSMAVMVLPIEEGKPNYRDSVPPPFRVLGGYDPLIMAPIMRAPEVTVMAGQTSFASVITKREEAYPIGVSVVGTPGSDLLLLDLVTSGMRAGGIPLHVKVGSSIY